MVESMEWREVLIVALAGVVAVVGGGVLTKSVFRLVDRRPHDGQSPPSDAAESAADDDASDAAGEGAHVAHDGDGPEPGGGAGEVERAGSVLRGGAWIGALERLAIFAGLVAAWPEAIALTLALKGLGRYPELRNHNAPAVAERFIIGTFVSVMWACACAGVAIWLRA